MSDHGNRYPGLICIRRFAPQVLFVVVVVFPGSVFVVKQT